MDHVSRLNLTVDAAFLPRFYQLLEQGFILFAPPGCSVRDFVCRHLDVEPRYLEQRIQTIFLDQKPVDDLDTAVIRSRSVVALSAAMPGLAGATLRKGGQFAAMRQRITCSTVSGPAATETTPVTVKFFNMVARELGQPHLAKGIRLSSTHLAWFLEKYPDVLSGGIADARLDGEPVDPQTLAATRWCPEVFLRVSAVQI